ncbi:MAG: carboxypeptidase-like regulatory domain-containing protein [Gemmatimonadetes bacterium]|nr:carboxypeptidase-like regulatory domain-containing protein [Gemmatimonadota bacterium]
MRGVALPLFIGIACGAATPVLAQTQFVVEGRVVQESSGDPIANANIELDGQPAATTDSAGAFRFDNVPPGGWGLRVTALGWSPRDVFLVVRRDTSVVIVLSAAPLPLDTLAVRSRTVDIRGHARDRAADRDLFRARVVTNLNRETTTNTVGRFRLRDMPAGFPVVIGIRAFGYLPLDQVVIAENDTTVIFALEIDPLVQRMIDVEVARLEKRARPFNTAIMPAIDRETLMRRNGTALDVMKSEWGQFLSRIACILIDDVQRYNGLDELGLYFPEELERIEVLFRGRMLRIYTRTYIQRMLGRGTRLRDPVYIEFSRPPACY